MRLSVGELRPVLGRRIGRVERPGTATDRQHHRRNARDDQLGAERLGQLGRAVECPLRRLGLSLKKAKIIEARPVAKRNQSTVSDRQQSK